MARLPDLTALGNRPTPQSRQGIASFDGSDMARAVSYAGREVSQVADQLSREADAQAVFEARRKLDEWERTAIYDQRSGAINRLGKDALTLPDELPKAFDEVAGQVGASMSSPRQKQAFQELALSRRNQIADWASRHALREREVYDRGQFEADLKSMSDRAAMFATDPARVAGEIATGEARIIGYMRNKGLSEEETQAKLREHRSATHASVLNTMLAGDDWQSAQKYLDANGSQMEPATVLRLNNALRKQADVVEGAKAAQRVVSQVQPAMQPTDMDRFVNITMQSESGGRRFAPGGGLLTSPAGAKGEMQVMDGTNRDPGFGVTPARDDSPDERARVGRDYLAAMLKEYGGDPAKAWAAYNAGPGRLNQELKDAAKRGQPDAWLSNMPAETQAYVAKNLKMLGSGGGAPPKPTLQDVHQRIRTELAGQRPERVKVALDESTRLYEEANKAIKQRDEEATAEAQRALVANGGSWASLPAAVRMAVPAEKVDDLLNFSARIAKGEDTTDPIVFQKMATDDAWVKGMSDAEFFFQSRKLSQADQQQMALRRGQLLNKQPAQGQKPTDLDFAAVRSLLDERLLQMGIDPTPANKDLAGQQRVGAIRGAVHKALLDRQQAAGKKFDDADLTKQLDKIITQNVTLQTRGFFGGTKTAPERLISMKPGDIPTNVRERLKADFAAQGVPSPSESDLLGAYLQIKLAQGN